MHAANESKIITNSSGNKRDRITFYLEQETKFEMETTDNPRREKKKKTSVKPTCGTGVQAASTSLTGIAWLSLVLAAAAVGYSVFLGTTRSPGVDQLELRTMQLEREFANLAQASRSFVDNDKLAAAIMQVTGDKAALSEQINAVGQTVEQINLTVLSRNDPSVISDITQTLEMIRDTVTSVEQRQDQLSTDLDAIRGRLDATPANQAAPSPALTKASRKINKGTWVINMASARTQREAETFLKQVEALGYAAELYSVKING